MIVGHQRGCIFGDQKPVSVAARLSIPGIEANTQRLVAAQLGGKPPGHPANFLRALGVSVVFPLLR